MKLQTPDRATVALLISGALLLVFAVSCTATEFAAGAAVVSAGAASILDAVGPLLSPEQFAKIRAGVESLDGGVAATKATVSVIVDAFESFRDAVAARHDALAAASHAQEVLLAGKATTGEAVGYSLGGGAVGTGASRWLSMVKHGVTARSHGA